MDGRKVGCAKFCQVLGPICLEVPGGVSNPVTALELFAFLAPSFGLCGGQCLVAKIGIVSRLSRSIGGRLSPQDVFPAFHCPKPTQDLVKEFKLSYSNEETPLFTKYPYYGN